MSTTTTMTHAEHQALKAQRKAEREWQKTVREAKVYDARVSRRRATPAVVGDVVLERLANKANTMATLGQKEIDRFRETLAEDPARAMEWSSGAFKAAAQVKTGREVMAWVAEWPARGDEYSAPSSIAVARWVVAELEREIMREARYPSRCTSVQSNEIAREIASCRSQLLEDAGSYLSFYSEVL